MSHFGSLHWKRLTDRDYEDQKFQLTQSTWDPKTIRRIVLPRDAKPAKSHAADISAEIFLMAGKLMYGENPTQHPKILAALPMIADLNGVLQHLGPQVAKFVMICMCNRFRHYPLTEKLDEQQAAILEDPLIRQFFEAL